MYNTPSGLADILLAESRLVTSLINMLRTSNLSTELVLWLQPKLLCI